ncbi:MAG: hypothetical protein Tsb0017_00600 [Geothermobacteraceae bacterium]
MRVVPFDADPETLLRQRIDAFRRGEFGFIYDSYHSEAPFLRQFPDREDYLSYAREEIAGRITIERFRLLRSRSSGDRAELIFHQLLRGEGGYQESFEMAVLLREGGLWRYLGSSRMDRSHYRGRVEDLDFDHFDQCGVVFF